MWPLFCGTVNNNIIDFPVKISRKCESFILFLSHVHHISKNTICGYIQNNWWISSHDKHLVSGETIEFKALSIVYIFVDISKARVIADIKSARSFVRVSEAPCICNIFYYVYVRQAFRSSVWWDSESASLWLEHVNIRCTSIKIFNFQWIRFKIHVNLGSGVRSEALVRQKMCVGMFNIFNTKLSWKYTRVFEIVRT